MQREYCSRGLLKCKIRGHNHESNNIGVFFGYSEDVCNIIQQSVRIIDQKKYIRMYKELDSKNISHFLIEILSNCENDYVINAPLYFIVILNILNTNYGRNLLARSNKLHLIVNNKLFELNNDLCEHHPYYALKKVLSGKLEVEIFHERLAYFYLSKAKDTIFSDFSEKVEDSDNLFSEVVKFL